MSGHHLILGGAKSGKTAFAESLALDLGDKPVYLATGQAWDDEMRARIDAHKTSRADKFITIEEPLNLAQILDQNRDVSGVILIDCLTLWITNLMMAEMGVEKSVDALISWLSINKSIDVILVSNEVGQGIVPDNKMARAFRDHAGISHQKLAKICTSVTFVTAGIAQRLKG
ncbi:bifunctional adenosylcobinamide kinase/adenosylcobinamide-phosphate guanylyltransferase [Maritalea sp.]|uniref:bifunctional adenosylcobinamide kinase/adenosylcobinamide-phosphate guanylyltransferase n=1 Tax=Maritalea sp. TaxID=2003361 RepID=UPI0039E4D79A